MPKLTVESIGRFEVPQGKRLVLALEQDAGVDQLHACGENARCTTRRVVFVAGEPDRMTVAERDVLNARELSGIRLSCQIACDHVPRVDQQVSYPLATNVFVAVCRYSGANHD